MEDKKTAKNEFVRETIRNKPFNKKRAAIRLLFSALCGVVFAVSASLVFAVVMPYLTGIVRANSGDDTQAQESQQPQESQLPQESQQPSDSQVSQSTEDSENLSDSQNSETLPPQGDENEQGTTLPDTNPPETVIIQQSLEITDYQTLQDQLYRIGREANRSIVTVTRVVDDMDIFNNPYEVEGQSSGVVIAEKDEKYLILTERKGIEDASRVNVTFIDDSIGSATLVKEDPNTGLVVLSVDKSEISQMGQTQTIPAKFGDSRLVKSGTIVLALGSPLGTNYSILAGNITSNNNEITTVDHNFSVLTTNIVANPNGSGVLINVNGEIVGIVMQDFSAAQAGNTLTAIASSDVVRIIEMLADGKDIPYLGLSVSTVTEKIAREYEIPKGTYIREVSMDSPAMAAGIQSGDVVVSVDGIDVFSAETYANTVLGLSTDTPATIVLKRKGATAYTEITCQVTPGVMKRK